MTTNETNAAQYIDIRCDGQASRLHSQRSPRADERLGRDDVPLHTKVLVLYTAFAAFIRHSLNTLPLMVQ